MITRSRKGISLISLVITIVILIILSSISIKQIGDNRIISETKNAKEKSEILKIVNEVNIKLLEMKTLNKDISNLNNWESINYVLPEKYKDSLFLINGIIYCSYFENDEIKKICMENGIYPYYVLDNSTLCVSNCNSKIILEENEYKWEDLSGKNNGYTIYNYGKDCKTNNGILLRSSDKRILSGKISKCKTSIITISSFETNEITYKLFRGSADSFFSNINVSNTKISAYVRYINSGYKNFSVNIENNNIKLLQVSFVEEENYVKIYINGKYVGSESGTLTPISSYIGGRLNPYTNSYEFSSNYVVNSVLLYDRALNEEEIMNNYNVDLRLFNK